MPAAESPTLSQGQRGTDAVHKRAHGGRCYWGQGKNSGEEKLDTESAWDLIFGCAKSRPCACSNVHGEDRQDRA
jgi:hypothetical protein